jgi:hypothetical protein
MELIRALQAGRRPKNGIPESGRWCATRAEGRRASPKATRALVGEDGHKLVAFWFSIMDDPMRRHSDRLEA